MTGHDFGARLREASGEAVGVDAGAGEQAARLARVTVASVRAAVRWSVGMLLVGRMVDQNSPCGSTPSSSRSHRFVSRPRPRLPPE